MDDNALGTEWPAFPYEAWRAIRDTLHMYAQVVGKLRLALSAFKPHWGNVPFFVMARGLTTRLTLDGGFQVHPEGLHTPND